MPVLSFKGNTAVETYHHTVPHHTSEFDKKLFCLPKYEDAYRDDKPCCMMYPCLRLLKEPLGDDGAMFVPRAETRPMHTSDTPVRSEARKVMPGPE